MGDYPIMEITLITHGLIMLITSATLIRASFDPTDKLTAGDQMSFLPSVLTNRQSAIMFQEIQYTSSRPWILTLIHSGWRLYLALHKTGMPPKKFGCQPMGVKFSTYTGAES